MGAAELAIAAAAATRFNREDCKRTKHDSLFSNWQVLVGPSDWEDHSLGKEGVSRYRVHNLPTSTAPGLYELGITVSPPGSGRVAGKINSDGVVVVYLGQADNVRTRLQCYGRSGAHLNNSGLKRELGYFDDIFSRGHSIVYRWVPMKSKADALKAEAELLDRFDYAWNKGSNGVRRHHDILGKLNKAPPRNFWFPKLVRKLLRFTQKPVGIKIKETRLLSPGQKFNNYADGMSNNLFPQVIKFSKSQPRMVSDRQGAEDRNLIINGSISKSNRKEKSLVEIADLESSISGNGESDHHRTLSSLFSPVNISDHHRTLSSLFSPVNIPIAEEKCTVSQGSSETFGVVLDDGSLCIKQPVQGNKICNEHKSMKAYGSDPKSGGTSQSLADVVFDSSDGKALNYNKGNSPEIYEKGVIFSKSSEFNLYNSICGVGLGNEYFSTSQLFKGIVRCEEHKGLKVSGNFSRSGESDNTHVYDEVSTSSEFDGKKQGSSTCGESTLNDSYCTRPIKDKTNGGQHSALLSGRDSTFSPCNDLKYRGTFLCGATTENGSYCRRQVKGGGRCWQHPTDARRCIEPARLPSVHMPDRDSRNSSCSYWNNKGTSLCGAPTQKGSYCRRQVNGGGRCWQHSVDAQAYEELGLLSSFDKESTISSSSNRNYGGTSLCGARTRNGSCCKRPVKDGGRCWQH